MSSAAYYAANKAKVIAAVARYKHAQTTLKNFTYLLNAMQALQPSRPDPEAR